MASSPKASSTPKTIKGRPSIRTSAFIQSPIESSSNSEQDTSPETEQEDLLEGSGSQIVIEENRLQRRANKLNKLRGRSSSYSYEVTPDKKQIIAKEKQQISGKFYLGIITLVAILLSGLYFIPPVGNNVNGQILDFANLEKLFPPQQEDFWLSIKVAINDIIHRDQPKTIIFLYKDVNTTTKLLEEVSKYASSLICDSEKPLNLSGGYLQSKEILEDYGKFIAEVRNELNTKCVVIINNLDEVPGSSAQAFHSLCDEYNPVKENVLFLFTLKVDEFPENTYKFVEKRLRELWSELHSDKFYPLYTRISTFILPVISEH